MIQGVSTDKTLDKHLKSFVATWESLKQASQQGSSLQKARWKIEEQALSLLLQKAQSKGLALREKQELCSLIEEILLRCQPKVLLQQAQKELESNRTIAPLEHFSRETQIVISKTNIQASWIMVQGMNFIREHATLLSRYPEIIQHIRASELTVIQGREKLRLATPESLNTRLANLQGAIVIHRVMLNKAKEWTKTLQHAPSSAQAIDSAKQSAAQELILEALALQKKQKLLPPHSILAALSDVQAKIEYLEDPLLQQYLQEKSCILLKQLQEALFQTG